MLLKTCPGLRFSVRHGASSMARQFRISLIVLLGASLIGQPIAYANGHGGGGHGGGGHMGGGHRGGGHMGGGHMGGGHMGGGQMGGFGGGGGHMGGGHMGGFSGGHVGGFSGGHVGGFNGGHVGGVPHMGGGYIQGGHVGGGIQHNGFQGSHIGSGSPVYHGQSLNHGIVNQGGVNHGVRQGMSNSSGIYHNGAAIQHNGGLQHNSGMSTPHQNAIQSGGSQHLGTHVLGSQNAGAHRPGSQSLGTHSGSQNHLGGQGIRLGNQQQNQAPFYQNHALHHGGTAGAGIAGGAHGTHLSHGANAASHHSGSQFLSNHAGHQSHSGHSFGHNGSTAGSHHASVSSAGLSHHNFLSHHNVTSVTTAHHGTFLNGSGNHANHHGLNNVGSQFNHQHAGSWNHGNWNNAGWNHGHNGGNWHNGNWNHGHWNNWNHRNWNNWNSFGFGWGLGWGLGWGWGWGWPGYFWPYYGGFGWPYGYWGGYGLGGLFGLNGFGLSGLGFGYGLNNAYLNWGCIPYQTCCAAQPLTYGYASSMPGYGGYGGLGLGSNALAYGPQSQLSALGVATATDAPPAVEPVPTAPTPDKTSGASSGLPTAEEFAQIGEAAFKNRDYKGAVRAWRHGLVDDPENPVLILMLSQALFATEQYRESAGAIQAAMQTLPPEKWDVVVKNFRELYGKGEDYTTQVRSLEKAAREKTDDPGLRFLLGYHYGFLGYPAEAVKQLEKCVKLAPRDEVARKLLDLFDDKLPKKSVPAPGPGEPPATTSPGATPEPPTPDDNLPPPPLNAEPKKSSP
jgi:hypothetical protein